MSDYLNVLRRLPSDFVPYGERTRDDVTDDCSCGCRWFSLLADQRGADWGVCLNPASPRAGLLTFEHQGCPAFEGLPWDDEDRRLSGVT